VIHDGVDSPVISCPTQAIPVLYGYKCIRKEALKWGLSPDPAGEHA
jgi:hypothetical protein